MIMDKQQMFSEAQSAFSAGTTVNSANVIDLVKANQDLGVGEELYIVVAVTTAFVGGTSITFNLLTDDNVGMTTPAVVAILGTQTIAQLPINTLLVWRFPQVLAVPMERYIALQFSSTGTSTAGVVTAGIVKDVQKWKAYPSNFVSA